MQTQSVERLKIYRELLLYTNMASDSIFFNELDFRRMLKNSGEHQLIFTWQKIKALCNLTNYNSSHQFTKSLFDLTKNDVRPMDVRDVYPLVNQRLNQLLNQ